ncbi:MAG TPA: OmpA family protein [Bryobacteraceae bacterium]|jgi:OmpA-OmpF porin, OOP family|nr:OmpA family protein [Bryobacteraceae bacterium]
MIPDFLKTNSKWAAICIGGLLLASSGCATKKHVRNTIQPVEQRVGSLEQKNTENEKAIEDLEAKTSKIDEFAKSADQRAQDAMKAAKDADEQAKLGQKKAEDAMLEANAGKKLAEQGIGRLDTVEKRILGLDNYAVVADETVYFDLAKDGLSKEAQELLNGLATRMGTHHRYLIEVQGFTDTTGTPQFNMELSRRRADAVVRYLTLQHKVPLHRITVIGLGPEAPTADNKSRDGRKQNRRVEVRVFSADTEARQTAQAGTQVAR